MSSGNNRFNGGLTFEQYINSLDISGNINNLAKKIHNDIQKNPEKTVYMCTFIDGAPFVYRISDNDLSIVLRTDTALYAGADEAIRFADSLNIPLFQEQDIDYIRSLFSSVYFCQEYGKNSLSSVGELVMLYKMHKDGKVEKIIDLEN